MVHIHAGPGKTVDGMALNTILGKSPQNMIGIRGCHIIGLVTIIALHTQGFKTKK
jgi:hypothetical protein